MGQHLRFRGARSTGSSAPTTAIRLPAGEGGRSTLKRHSRACQRTVGSTSKRPFGLV
jgi:hypothetical protein